MSERLVCMLAGRLQAGALDNEAPRLDVDECLLPTARSVRLLCVLNEHQARSLKKKEEEKKKNTKKRERNPPKIPLLQLKHNIRNLAISVARGQRVYWH